MVGSPPLAGLRSTGSGVSVPPIHVHRLHFESEFRTLRMVWRKFVKMRREMSSLRPMFSIGVPRSAEEDLQLLQKRFTAFTTTTVRF